MKITDFKNKHKNKLCFLYGAGPSLHFIDTELLKNYISICVNSGVLKCLWCNYFVSDDVGVKNWSYYVKLLSKLSCVKFLYDKKLKNYCNHLNNICLFDHMWWFSPPNSYNFNGLKLNKIGPIIGARTSMGSAIHLSYIMGCNPIVLLGNDCKIKDNKRYFWEYWDLKEQPYRLNGSVFNKRSQLRGFDKKSFIEYWNNFARINKDILENELQIIDASDSALDCFPKMSIEKILEKYG